MNILFIHGNYPAQFKSILIDLGGQGIHDIRFLTARKDPGKFPIKGIKTLQYEDVNNECREFNTSSQAIANELISRGEIVQRKVIELINDRYIPQLVIFHGGNGLGLFLRQALPKAALIGYFEWYFSNRCAKLILNCSNIATLNYIQTRNISTENEILSCDAAVVPTQWQASQFPSKLQENLSIIFDGVDTSYFKPRDNALFEEVITIQGEDNALTINKGELLLTYATRGMEPLRGFPEFVRAIPTLLEKLPNLKILIGGRDRSAYGPRCPSHEGSWKEMMLEEIPILKNHPRITFTGLMSYGEYLKMLQRTNLHIYLTHPYVTSWSLFEAAACGAPVLTNQSAATTGIIPMAESNTINSVEEMNQPEGISKALTLLTMKSNKRCSNLESKFSLDTSKNQWEKLINTALKRQ